MNEVGLGLIVAAAVYGLRHGFDLDHLAAIGDIAGSARDRRRALRLATAYVAGHALVVLALGMAAVRLGAFLPATFDDVMGRIVGVTLIGLGVYLTYSAIRYRGDIRFRSRWMLAADGVRALAHRMHRAPRQVIIEHTHGHSHDGSHEHEHHEPLSARPGSVATVTSHAHVHTHVAMMPMDPFKPYSSATAFGIGMIHGIGAETPSQILLFASAAGAGTVLGGTAVLVAFILGLVVANGIVAFATAIGFAGGTRMPRVYLTAAVVAAIFSLVVGLGYLIGSNDLLPL